MRKQLLTLLFLCGWLLAGTSLALAAGVVGDGKPTSCTEAALTTALAGGGAVSFNCGEAATITLTTDQPITAPTTTIDGGGKVTLRGGALLVAPDVALTVNNLTMAGSPRAAIVNNGGTVTVNASRFISNTNGSDGGAIVNQNGTLTINSTTFAQNQGAQGGAIVSTGSAQLAIDDSDFIENRATIGNGGAISVTAQHGPITISKTTFFSNEASNRESGSGGALAVGENGQVTLVNDTLVGNHAAGEASGGGHALYLQAGATVAATNSTIAFHIFDRGAASINVAIWAEPTARITLANSILHDSECFGPATDNGHNVASFAQNGCNITNVSSTAILDFYDTNGGRHITYQPRKNGPASDKIDSALCPATDQRGISRPQGAKCDIGAIEYSEPAIGELSPAKAKVRGTDFVLTINGQNLLDGMIVRWNGSDLATTFVSTTQLQALVPASKLVAPGTATIQIYVPNRQTSNTLTLPIVETVEPDLHITVSDQPNVCGTETAVTVLPNTPVTICYTLHNSGSMTLTRHTLSDTWVGQVLTNEELLLPAQDIYVIKRTFTPPYPLSILATWTAMSSEEEFGMAQATATVNVINPKLGVVATVGQAAGVCATTKAVTINYGESVTYCVTVTSQGDATLDRHTLVDSLWGEQFKDETRPLDPGASYSYLYTVTPKRTRQSVVTWTAYATAVPNVPQIASDRVDVTIVEQDFREVGELRIWADQFVTNADGSITASSRVRIGPKSAGSDSKYYSVSTTVSWRGDGPVTGSGLVGTADGDVALMEGGFAVDTTIGVITWQPDAVLRYAFLGASSVQLSNTSISFTMIQPYVTGSGSIAINLVGNEPFAATLNFTIGVDGSVVSAFNPITVKVGGANLSGQLTADARGLRIIQATLDLPTPGVINLPDLIIDGYGETGIHFADELTRGAAPLIDMDLGNGVLTLWGLTGKIVRVNNVLALDLSGQLRVAQIPDNDPIDIPVSGLRLLDKKLGGAVGTTQIAIEGFPLQFVGAQLQAQPLGNGFEYLLQATALKLGVPTKWDLPFIDDKLFDIPTGGAIATAAPIVRVLVDKVPVPQKFNLIGNERKSIHVHLTDVKVTIKYAELGTNWNVELGATINFKFGKDSSVAPGVKLIYKGGKVSAMLTDAALKVAGLGLQVKDMAYIDDVFTASNAKLSLPQSWGGSQIGISKVRIDDNGLKFGEADGKFPIPNFTLFKVLQVSNTTATLATDAKTTYAVVLTTTLTITNVEVLDNANASATGALRIADGRVSGTVTGFGFKLVGLGFRADKAQFLDDRIKAEVVSLTLPRSLGGAATTISGLEVGGPAGFAIRGGTFKLPDFTIGNVGFKNVNAQFETDTAGNYLIGADAKLAFEAFSVEGQFKLAYVQASDSVQVRRVFLAYEGRIEAGTAIPIADTGFFLTGVWGSFDLNDQTFTVNLGVKGQHILAVADKHLVTIEGQVSVRGTPFEFHTNANAKFLGITVAQTDLRITSHSMTLSAEYNNLIIHSSLELAFGKDIDGETTMYGSVYASVGLKKGFIGSVDLGIVTANIPPFDITISGERWEAGKFLHDHKKVWGARLTREFFGFHAYVFARFAPGIGLDGGFNLDSYRPVRPAALTAAGVMAADATLPYTVDVTRTTTTLVVLEAVTVTNWINPQDIQVVSPNGVPFTLKLEYAGAEAPETRIYTIKLADPQQAVGGWQILPQAGNAIAIWGVDQPPVVSSFDATANNVALATVDAKNMMAAAAQPPVVNGGALTFAWRAGNNEPGFVVDLYLEGADGMRYLVAHQQSVNETTLQGTVTWTPALASGIYTPTLVVDDYRNVPTTVRKAPIQLQDTTAPAAPQGLAAQARADGSVLLTWNGAAAEADVAGYAVAVNGGAPIRQLGHFSQYEVFGLTAGTTNQIAVAAYDLSGNLGTPAVVAVGMPAVGVNALNPARNGYYSDTISIVFDQVITPTAFTLVNAQGATIAGAVQPITDEVVHTPTTLDTAPATDTVTNSVVITNVIESVTIGVRFVPATALPAGAYVATARATAADGTPVEVSWPFTVLPTLYDLTIGVNGGGLVVGQGDTCDSTCTTSQVADTVVTLTAEAAPGFIFSGWSGACSGNGACQVTMNSAKSVSATFVPIPTYGLTVQVNGNGVVNGQGIACGAACTESYQAGTVVKLNPVPAQGFVFSGWGGACSGVGDCSVTMDRDQQVTASFTTAPPPTTDLIYLSGSKDSKLGRLKVGDEDILAFNPATVSWSLIWDGSDVGIHGDLDDFAILDDGSILMSFEQPERINGMMVTDADIVRFIPTTLGVNTTGRFEFYFDGSDVGLTTNAEDIDAFDVLANGDLLLSTRGAVAVPGVSAGDTDLLRFTPSSLGLNTAGTWSLALRGVDVGLDARSESVRSLWVADDGKLYLTSEGDFMVDGGVSGDGNDIFVCTPSGPPALCSFSRFWDGATAGFTGGFIDGLDLHSGLTTSASADEESVIAKASDESDLVDDGDVVDDNETVIEEPVFNNFIFLPVVSNN
ncbi:MAG: choice-of-anchor Q domain-containing protein [Caldilineaceae bacterium]